jgi:hypothetical protein
VAALAPPVFAHDLGGVLSCSGNYRGPASLGWCRSGTFLGPVHTGAVFWAGTQHDFRGGVQIAAVTHVGRDFLGLAQVGLLNRVDGTLVGIQLGLLNETGNLHGVQLGITNHADNEQRLLAVGFLGNRARALAGIQVSLLRNYAEEVVGAQLAVFSNRSSLEVRGGQIQVGAAFGVATIVKAALTRGFDRRREIYGLAGLLLGGFNQANAVRGVQIAGWYNEADTVSGGQLAVLNRAEEATGVSIGLVNRARRIQGLQVGLINSAGNLQGLQLGLLNHADNGLLRVLPFMNAGWN